MSNVCQKGRGIVLVSLYLIADSLGPTRMARPFMMTSRRLSDLSQSSALRRSTFEVYGRVQGVYFRKHTVEKAESLGLRGYVLNTKRGTVYGEMEGENKAVDQMKRWLRNEGSPKSHIEKAEFKDEKSIDKFSFDGFEQRRGRF
ncbi:unnamed protein product [Cyprideis torosa]|uniref:acylphosphatase n=1 Tax=Cyprideis torosa TaxID=163714 RepID=A0A7R8W8G0_9CRUS|nr:unnamed protein product [Cyprideis torosa]CAG0883740.1 unnamed protein product [Cyprideis torosa]